MNNNTLLETERITLKSTPYAYVRTIVMESNLFRKHEYAKLLKMSISEIIQFLEETNYKKEIDELAVTEHGVQLVEHSVQRNFRRAGDKLRRISDDRLRFLIDTYLWRNDIQNIKTIVRAKRSNEPAERVHRMLIPGTLPKEAFIQWYHAATVEELLQQLDTPFTADAQVLYQRGVVVFESELSKRYYQATLSISHRITDEGSLFKNFLVLEVDVVNIMTSLKLKHEGMSAERIQHYIIRDPNPEQTVGHRIRKHLAEELAAAPSLAACFKLLKESRFKTVVSRGIASYEQTHSLIDLERDFQTYLLRRTTLLTHQHPLSGDIVLSYLFEKVNEIRNIMMLVKAKQLGVSESFIEQELVIP